MKRFKSLLIGVAAAVVAGGFLSSCTERRGENYLSALPSESVFMMKMNIASMTDKSEILESPFVKNNLEQSLEYLSRSTRQVVNEALENPASTGIDFRRPMVLAVENINRPKGLLLFAVNDADKLTDFIETLLEEDEISELPVEWDEREGIHTLSVEGNTFMAYDATKLVFASSFGGKKADATEYLKLPEKEQALGSDDFKEFIGAEQDIVFYCDYEALMRLNPYLVSNSEMSKLYDNMKALFTTNFEAGRIAFTTKVFGNKTLQEMSEKLNMRTTGKYFAYIPAKNYGVITGGLRNLSSMIEYWPSDIRQPIEEGLDSLGTTVKILDKFEGDLTLAVLPMPQPADSRSIPQFFVAAECTDSELFDLFVGHLKDNQNVKKRADRLYALRLIGSDEDPYDYYLTYRENTIFLLPESLYTQLADGDRFKALDENFTQSPLAGALKGTSGLVIDFPTIAADLEQRENSSALTAGRFLRMLKDLTVIQVDTMTGAGTLNFTDSKTNALKQLTDMALGLIVGDLDK